MCFRCFAAILQRSLVFLLFHWIQKFVLKNGNFVFGEFRLLRCVKFHDFAN
jgi:hypothetical protein